MPNPSYFQPSWIEPDNRTIEADVCIYGGTAAGVVAAKTCAERGLSVVLLQPGLFLGGMTTGGLGWTDYGHQKVIGGASRQFYRDLGALDGKPEEWLFAPGAAQKVMDAYAATEGITVRTRQFLAGVEMNDGRIESALMLGGLRVRAKMWMDATYEGDLLARAGVSFHVGREANSVYGETINGVQIRDKHQFSHPIDPYIEKGNPASGVLPGIFEGDAQPNGSGDGKIQAYNFRVCMTDDPDLKIAWEKPDGFNERDHELARRWFASEKDSYNDQLPGYWKEYPHVLRKFDILSKRTKNGNFKTDSNNHGPISSDFIGQNWLWPEASYAERERIFQAHVGYQKGLYWFLANDESVPPRYREAYARFGLARDEFKETGGWPHQLYVREARRMKSDYVLTEADTQHKRKPQDPVGMGSYAMDSHNCSRFVRDGHVLNEGDVQLQPAGPYSVSYRSIVPARGECQNLLVPVCVSSSHIAFGSVRMEPVFMILGESAALAAHLAIQNNTSVQDVPYAKLRPLLDEAKQVVEMG